MNSKRRCVMMEMTAWPRSAWSIFDELESLQESMNSALNGYSRSPERRLNRYPLMNVWTSPEGLVIDAELPGAVPDDVEISVMGDTLTLSGKVNATPVKEGEQVYRQERPAGAFSRTLQLPFRAASDGVKAAFQDGILRISVPRSEEEKPRRIAIESA